MFPLPLLSLLTKQSRGGVEPLKAVKLLLEQGQISKDVVLLLDKMYVQKCLQYHDGRVYGSDAEGKLCKGIMAFLIVGLKNNIPFVIKSIPKSKIEGQWLAEEIDESIKSLHEVGFNVRAVISDNHATNLSAFHNLYEKFRTTQINAIVHYSSPAGLVTYLLYDSVHLGGGRVVSASCSLTSISSSTPTSAIIYDAYTSIIKKIKNIENNLLNFRRCIFPPFEFDEFLDSISLRGGEISWKLLHNVYDKDQSLKANLRKARKLTYKALHPGDNKQSVPLALAVFDPTTSGALSSYFLKIKTQQNF